MAIINSVCIAIMALGAILYVGVHKKGTFQIDVDNKIPVEARNRANRDSGRLFFSKIIAVILVSASVLLYYKTEDLSGEFGEAPLYNEWSVYHLILLLLFFLVMFIGTKGLNKVSNGDSAKGKTESSLFLD